MTDDTAKSKKQEVVEDIIDQSLVRVYREILDEGTPPRFHQLLEQLRQALAPDKRE